MQRTLLNFFNSFLLILIIKPFLKSSCRHRIPPEKVIRWYNLLTSLQGCRRLFSIINFWFASQDFQCTPEFSWLLYKMISMIHKLMIVIVFSPCRLDFRVFFKIVCNILGFLFFFFFLFRLCKVAKVSKITKFYVILLMALFIYWISSWKLAIFLLHI